MPFEVGLLLSVNRWVRLLTNHLARRTLERTRPALPLAGALRARRAARRVLRHPAPLLALPGRADALGPVLVVHQAHRDHPLGRARRRAGRRAASSGSSTGSCSSDSSRARSREGSSTTPSATSGRTSSSRLVSATAVPFGARGATAGAQRRAGAEPARAARARGRGDLPLLAQGFLATCVGTGLIMSTVGYLLKASFGASADGRRGWSWGWRRVNALLISLRYVDRQRRLAPARTPDRRRGPPRGRSGRLSAGRGRAPRRRRPRGFACRHPAGGAVLREHGRLRSRAAGRRRPARAALVRAVRQRLGPRRGGRPAARVGRDPVHHEAGRHARSPGERSCWLGSAIAAATARAAAAQTRCYAENLTCCAAAELADRAVDHVGALRQHDQHVDHVLIDGERRVMPDAAPQRDEGPPRHAEHLHPVDRRLVVRGRGGHVDEHVAVEGQDPFFRLVVELRDVDHGRPRCRPGRRRSTRSCSTPSRSGSMSR